MLKIELDREEDGRWIADIPELPGVMCYGNTREHAIHNVQALCFYVLADRVEHNEAIPELFTIYELTASEALR